MAMANMHVSAIVVVTSIGDLVSGLASSASGPRCLPVAAGSRSVHLGYRVVSQPSVTSVTDGHRLFRGDAFPRYRLVLRVD